MRAIALMIALALVAMTSQLSHASDIKDPLADWQWNKRLLVSCLVDVEKAEPSRFVTSYKDFNWSGFAERDIEVVEIYRTGIYTVQPFHKDRNKRVEFLIKTEKGKPLQEDIIVFVRYPHTDKEDSLRNLAGCEKTGDFILIGRDGTVKRRWTNLVPMDELFATIDAMPMRQREMRERKE